MENFFDEMNIIAMDEKELKMMNPLKFAYIGDAIYELYIRNYVLIINKKKINDINSIVVRYVKATSQSYAIINMKSFLTEKEWEIVKWGRNQKSVSSPKNVSISDYKYATGFETLIGYLYLMGEKNRLDIIISKAISITDSMGG